MCSSNAKQHLAAAVTISYKQLIHRNILYSWIQQAMKGLGEGLTVTTFKEVDTKPIDLFSKH